MLCDGAGRENRTNGRRTSGPQHGCWNELGLHEMFFAVSETAFSRLGVTLRQWPQVRRGHRRDGVVRATACGSATTIDAASLRAIGMGKIPL